MSENVGLITGPHPYQWEFLDAIEEARGRGQKKFLGVMATGLGKTVVSAFDVKRLLERRRGRVLYLCHSNHILGQARKTFEAILGQSYTYGFFHGTEKHLHHVDVLFASFQTMATWREAFLRDEFLYIVVDEFHHAHAATFRPTIQYFQPESMLGLTATPERGDGLDITTLLGKPVFELGLFKALGKRHLCDVDYRIMTDELQRLEVLDTPVGQLSIAELNRTIFVPKRDEEIARIIVEKSAEVKNPRVMIFCASIEHAKRMAALMPHAAVVHSKLKGKERHDRLEAFRAGSHSTIITVDMLNEGIDVPEANIIIFLRSTASRTIFLQQLGRGLRKARGKLKVLVLDFVANCERFEMIDQLQQGVKRERTEKVLSGREGEGNGSPEPLTITLDGITFDERAWELFGKLREIRERPGVTREELIAQLRALAQEMGSIPRQEDVARASRQGRMRSIGSYAEVFGSYGRALEAAGLSVRKVFLSEEEMLDELRSLSHDLGKVPTQADVTDARKAGRTTPSPASYRHKFGSFAGALEAAGLGSVSNEPYSTEMLVQQLRDLARSLGRTPMTRDVARASSEGRIASRSTFSKRFGGFEKALMAAGLQVRSFDRATLAKQLSNLAAELGHTPTVADVNAASSRGSGANYATFLARFGSFNEALREAGLQINVSERQPRPVILEQLQSLARQLGATPTRKDIDRARAAGECVGMYQITAEFGSLTEALVVAGLELNVARRRRVQSKDEAAGDRSVPNGGPSDSDLFEYLRQLTIRLVRMPTEADVSKAARRKNGIDLSVFVQRFGSLGAALARAGVSRG
jgi:superfamily II DNA or RNA helicase